MTTRKLVDPIPALEELATAAHGFARLLRDRDVTSRLSDQDAEQVVHFFKTLASAGRTLAEWQRGLR